MKGILRFHKLILAFFTALGVTIYFCLPNPLFSSENSTVITDSDGKLLGAKIADDGQWRFPELDSIPHKFEQCIIRFEDQYFYYHPGINIVSVARALKANVKAGKVVQGGSTISMQTIRLARQGKERSFYEKCVEAVWALSFELQYSKKEILNCYCSHAPFGGNVVGLNAASWRYFGRPPHLLSWAESALLAVLPNAPSLMHPGKNRQALTDKRNRLLKSLKQDGIVSDTEYRLALLESIPRKPNQLPQSAYHLLMRYDASHKGKQIATTIDGELQAMVNRIAERHHKKLAANYIHNIAAIVAEVKTGNVLAYVGNAGTQGKGNHVDVIRAPRSSGSILKPFLYACINQSGDILPRTLVPDVPTYLDGFSPQNFNRSYDGAVPAIRALSRSLNIPAVRMLQSYGVPRFHEQLTQLGMTSLTKPASYYGLSLILGGAEISLWDAASMYASCSRVLQNYWQYDHVYNRSDVHPLQTDTLIAQRKDNYTSSPVLSAASIWLAYEAMLEVNRPDEEGQWEYFSSSKKIAWKTGTSFGFRDAWAVGTTADYVVAVWCGNADGEGRPNLVGVKAAAPVMFDIFKLLPQSSWFVAPFDELPEIATCRTSGHRAGPYCQEVDTVHVCENGLNSQLCPYHINVHLSKDEQFQVTSACEPVRNMKHTAWFVLPTVQAWYYKQSHPSYKPLPPFRTDCAMQEGTLPIGLVFPKRGSKIYIPNELDGSAGQVVFEARHRQKDATVYWHLDDTYIGATTGPHQIALRPSYGKHRITVIDGNAFEQTRNFEVFSQ